MEPRIIEFDTHVSSGKIEITVLETTQIAGFKINRIFWLTNAVKGEERGNHAHKSAYHVIFAIEGKIEVLIKSQTGASQVFLLDSPHKGLLLPPNFWRVVQYLDFKTIQMVASSAVYDPDDYILDYKEFLHHQYYL